MASGDSISRFIDEVKEGNDDAATAIWEQYFSDLVRIARQSLVGRRDPVADEEDVVVCAFKSFFKAAELGRFEKLRDRNALWRLLSQMTRRKAIDLIRRENRLKRPVQSGADGETSQNELDSIVGATPLPSVVAMFNEECGRFLGQLDAELRDVALKKMAEYTNSEIAEQLNCSVATVERRLKLIRKKWQREIGD